jgi:hypothetical protein
MTVGEEAALTQFVEADDCDGNSEKTSEKGQKDVVSNSKIARC